MNLLQSILAKTTKPAFLIGNGIHRYADQEQTNSSWEAIVEQLEELVCCEISAVRSHRTHGADLSLTERYDMIRLKASVSEVRSDVESSLVGMFQKLSDRRPDEHIKAITAFARSRNIPILTTNFDLALSEAGGSYDFNNFNSPFSQHYPWNSCFTPSGAVSADTCSHRIWHIHGSVKYKKSIRFGLRDYMGAVSKARELIHKGDDNLYRGKDVTRWGGYETWLHPFFNCDLIIFGLGLNSQEVFLRWLLLERAGYFAKFPDRKRKLVFIENESEVTAGKRAFVEAVGGELVCTKNYATLYKNFGSA